MLISADHNFIFLHVYKTGGNSLRHALLPYSDTPPAAFILKKIRALGLLRNFFYPPLNIFPDHPRATDVRDAVGADQFRRFYTFAVVRNPWAWHVSLYHFSKQRWYHHQYREMKKISNFEEYLHWRNQPENRRTQANYLCDDNGELLVSDWFPLETLGDHTEDLEKRLGVPLTLVHNNKSNHAPYSNYYTQQWMIDSVADMNKVDCQLFDYTFER